MDWLAISPGIGERYISTGSLYLCAAAFLPLGLPPSDPFWASPPEPFTAAARLERPGVSDRSRNSGITRTEEIENLELRKVTTEASRTPTSGSASLLSFASALLATRYEQVFEMSFTDLTCSFGPLVAAAESTLSSTGWSLMTDRLVAHAVISTLWFAYLLEIDVTRGHDSPGLRRRRGACR